MTSSRPQGTPTDEEYLRLATRNDKMFAYQWNPRTDEVVISTECAMVLGIRVEAHITSREVLSRVHPDDKEKLTTALAGISPENPGTQITFRVAHPDRGEIWVEMNSGALFDEAGEIVRISGMVADTTARRLAEMELATANDRLHLAMEASKSVGWDWDVRTGQDSWFGDLQTVFGIPSNTYIGTVEDFRRRLHPEDRNAVSSAIKHAMQHQSPYAEEFRILREDGTICWVAARGKFYYSANGQPERMLGIAVDITERKSAEEAFQRKDIELAEAQRLARVGSWRWKPENDLVTWSDELYRIAGRDPNLPAVTYEGHSQIYTAESWERLRLAVEEALRTGAQYEIEMEMVRPDGSTRWVIGRGETQRDAAGHIVGLHGTIQDITERRRAREALRESEERLRLAAQAGRMYAFEWDKATDVIVRSAEFSPILGLENQPKETTCQQMLDSVHPDDRANVIAATDGCTPENPTCRIRYRVLRPDGSAIWLEKHAHAFFDGKGRMLRMIGMIADVSERKLAEEAICGMSRKIVDVQEAERARIARDLHDDIGQRLALLSVSIEYLKRTFPATENSVRGRMDELREQVVNISSSIHAMSRDLHSSQLRDLDTVNAMRSFCMELSDQQSVEIHFGDKEIPEQLPKEISICLFRVLQEALHNALKHSKARHFEVELQGSPDAVCLTIRDAGIGFDPEAAMKGRGFGLTSMQERLTLVEGSLIVDSQPGRGTTVRAHIPFRPASAPASNPQ